MNWFTPKCPVVAEDKAWIDGSMLWLVEEFGSDTLRDATVVLPTDEFFPDPFSEDEEDVRALVERVCVYMGVDPERVELEFYTDENRESRPYLPFDEYSHEGVAGHYRKRRDKFLINIESSQLTDPIFLVATSAHELGHVRLIGEGRVSAAFEDHEPLTDLLTVFLGMGVFTGNSVFGFKQWTDAFSQGWQTERRGYMTEEMFGYALALFAYLRGERDPAWAKHLQGNVAAYFKSGHKYLEKTGDTPLKKL
ncbi:MAG TPA: hypothetical protein VEX70_17035 [Pyrinomonadaceae bacterium]|nr:hypothetical protein [Pyrinomonadaceae bacterium]